METKPNFVVPLADASAGLSQVGGKGASLARMAVAGLPVPPRASPMDRLKMYNWVMGLRGEEDHGG
jgi:hypothetical protein